MSFRDEVRRFAVKVEAKSQAIFAGVVADAKSSIQFGSPVTGAPGQPVETGNLRASWQVEFQSPTSALISTNVAYARSNEDGIRRPGGGPYRLRSKVGGRWSVKLTIAGMNKIVDDVARRLSGGGAP